MANELIGNDCPYCHGSMTVKQMACHRCNVTIDAAFPIQRLANLPVEHQRFIEMFVLAGGSLKEIASQTGVSYPTIRSRLNKIIDSLHGEIARTDAAAGGAGRDGGRMTAEDAAKLIKSI